MLPDLGRLQSLDEEAWSNAVPWFTGIARTPPTRAGCSYHEVESIVWETIEALVRCIGKAKDVKHLAGLTGTIARRRTIDRFRRVSTESNVPIDQDIPDQTALSQGEAEVAAIVGEALRQIDPKQREVLMDRYLEGLSYKEIAEKRMIPMGTVATYIARGEEQLKRVLEQNPKLLKEIFDQRRLLLMAILAFVLET